MTDATPLASEQITQEDRDLEAWFLRRMTGSAWEGHVARLLARHRIAALSASPASEQSAVATATVVEALEVGRQFLAACNSAWACGEPHHRVVTMLKRADEFQTALDAVEAATPTPPAGDA